MTKVEEVCGSAADAACTAEGKLVEAKLEMVCAARLLHRRAAVRHFRWFDRRNRLQRDEIDRCL